MNPKWCPNPDRCSPSNSGFCWCVGDNQKCLYPGIGVFSNGPKKFTAIKLHVLLSRIGVALAGVTAVGLWAVGH